MRKYKINNFLFGWDYIYWENSLNQGIARIHKLPDGKVIYWRYELTGVISEIEDASQVIWLTCSPSKYGF